MELDFNKYWENLKNHERYTEDRARVEKAYFFAADAHKTQVRKSGEPYITHPIAVSEIVANWGLDADSVIAALLHDVVEDTKYTCESIEKEFGPDIAFLVDGLTKLEKMNYETTTDFQADNLRKMILKTAKDPRVLFVKLADRLHNMRTLKFQPGERRKAIAQETLDIYSQFAHRLGIFEVKWELEDLSLLYLEPEKYYDIVQKVDKRRSEREEEINRIISKIKHELEANNVEYVDVYGRAKNLYSIYKKMYHKHKQFDELYDVTAVRVIVKEVATCYVVLGIVHATWNHMGNRFKDYISTPKSNGYQSIHTTVTGDGDAPFEIQIRTEKMHEIAERGYAAHFNYKHADQKNSELEKQLSDIGKMLESEDDVVSSEAFLNVIKSELKSDEIYVFTPQGKVIELCAGAIPIDFAYRVHSNVGNSCIGAKINGRIAPLTTELKNSDVVEIITSKLAGGPSRDWLKLVKTSNARNKIKHWLKTERRDENIRNGKEILHREIERWGFKVKDFLKDEWLSKILDKLTVSTLDDLYSAVGYGGIQTGQIIPKIRELDKEEKKKENLSSVIEETKKMKEDRFNKSKPSKNIVIEGLDCTDVRYAKCCSPVPGDAIIGFITRGRGITIHQVNCTNLESDPEARARYIEVSWAKNEDGEFTAQIEILAHTSANLITSIAQKLTNMNLKIRSIDDYDSKDGVSTIRVKVDIKDVNQLNVILSKLSSMKFVISAHRLGNN